MKNHIPNIMFIEINANKWNPKYGKTNRFRYFCHKTTLHLGANPPSNFAICVTCNLILNVSYVLHIKNLLYLWYGIRIKTFLDKYDDMKHSNINKGFQFIFIGFSFRNFSFHCFCKHMWQNTNEFIMKRTKRASMLVYLCNHVYNKTKIKVIFIRDIYWISEPVYGRKTLSTRVERIIFLTIIFNIEHWAIIKSSMPQW